MTLLQRNDWPVLIVDRKLDRATGESRKIMAIMKQLERLECTVLFSTTCEEALSYVKSRADLGCIVMDWDFPESEDPSPAELVAIVHDRNPSLPMLVMTDKVTIDSIHADIFEVTAGYIWIEEDSADFIAGRIAREVDGYIDSVLPPFFRRLVKYAETYKYAWHTPGHMGGFAFQRSPAGIACYKFFGENLFRADLSVSVPELGSLLDHEGVVGEAERESARVFGADDTFYVLNGTSTANQIVWRARVTRGDVALMDRNCHKSLNYAMIITGALPVYMMPSRNPYGTIGPIHVKELSRDRIRKKLEKCPFIRNADAEIRMAVITNSTYDGLCYNVPTIKKKLGKLVRNIHFDEAWYAYAKFHPIYRSHFGMSDEGESGDFPPVFATQSTHKLLAALSQASMIHIKNGTHEVISHDRFNEAYMMHCSTSPQYSMIATLDISTRMMKGAPGKRLMNETIEEAVVFRKKMDAIARELGSSGTQEDWWYEAWQPDSVNVDGEMVPFHEVETNYLIEHQECWTLEPNQDWHMFRDIEKDYIMLDPQKVTISTPGISRSGNVGEWGIPASIVTGYLRRMGIVVEKTGFYSWLCLFSMGTSKGKSGTLLTEMFDFRRLYLDDAAMEDVIPALVNAHPDHYRGMSVRDLCSGIHGFIRDRGLVAAMLDAFAGLPEQVLTPADTYQRLVKGEIEYVNLDSIMGRIPAVMVVPYPPGIPVIMPGERFTASSRGVLEYLQRIEEFEHVYPGFESDIHGVERFADEDGYRRFHIYCIIEQDPSTGS
jgi:arginine decarboxylase